MIRRNFLKLFGLLAVPTSALSAILRQPHTGRVRVQTNFYSAHRVEVKNKAEPVHTVNDKTWKDWVEHTWIPTPNFHTAHLDESQRPTHVEFYNVTEDSRVDVILFGGLVISFYPQWDSTKKEFKTVEIRFVGKSLNARLVASADGKELPNPYPNNSAYMKG